MSIDEFRAKLAEYDLLPPHIIADGKIHRFPTMDHRRDDAGWYSLHIDGEACWGGFGDHRRGLKEGWSSLSGKKNTAPQRQKMADAMKKAKAQAAKDEKQRNEACTKRARFIWGESVELKDHPYISKKRIIGYAARQYKNFIIIPLYNNGEMQSLQLISETSKKFLFGTKKAGSYVVLGEISDRYLVCEGWATGCSLHEITGLPVVIAWDAYNLVGVVKIFKKLCPDAIMIIAGDNDYGKAENVGAKYAAQAADAVGGAPVRLPPVIDEPPGRLSMDFNDLAVLRGPDAVREVIFPSEDPPADAPAEDIDAPFRVLGYDKDHFYYLPAGKNQIVSLTAGGHTLNNLFRLAPMGYWTRYGDIVSSKPHMATAVNDIMQQAERKGIFRAEERIRGIGAWVDENRHILHCGDRVYVNHQPLKPFEVEGQFIYEQCPRITTLHENPLKNAEAVRLRDLCRKLAWFNPLSGSLLAGWCVIAPVCAMLPWRPHIWITGEAQAGKTVVLRDIVLPMVGKMALRVDGGTTEAAIRQMLGHDARPIIYDEAEAENKKDAGIMEGIMLLARRSASGGVMVKGSATGEAMTYYARSAFCFSGINPSVKQRADEGRVSFLHLVKDREDGRDERYSKWQQWRAQVMANDFPARMLARTVAHLSTLIYNCEVFTMAAAQVLNDRRAADQVSAMLAGLYLLSSTGRVTLEKAKEWIGQHDWTQHTAIAEAVDHEMLIEYISTKTLRVPLGNMTADYPIGVLINCAGGEDFGVSMDIADKELRRLGIAVKNGRVFFANKSSNMAKLLEGQPWSTSWRRILGDIPESINEGPLYFFPGWTARAVSIPLTIFERE